MGAPGRLTDRDDPSARDIGGQLSLRIFACLKPVIAAVNGPAVGIGATMLLPMDVRIAAANARFGFVFARRGVVPEAASSWFLPRIVGMSTALDWCYSGELVPAEAARAAGLVSTVCDDGDALISEAIRTARRYYTHSSAVSVALTRQMMWRLSAESTPWTAHAIDSRLMVERGASADARQGIASFLDRRPASFPECVSADMPPTYPWWRDD